MLFREIIAEGRSGFEIVDPLSIDSIDPPDHYYYHVTTRPANVVRSGLRPNQRPTMDAGFYRSYSEGKVFFCERPGVPFWLWRIGDHLEAQFNRPPRLGVVRFPKSMAPNVQTDELGSRDSHEGSYYVNEPISPTISE
jgi:hypothetical protein